MPALHNIHYTYAEYLALEASSNVKHEFLEGQRSTTPATSSSTTRPSRRCGSTSSCHTGNVPWKSGHAKTPRGNGQPFARVRSRNFRSVRGSTFASFTRLRPSLRR